MLAVFSVRAPANRTYGAFPPQGLYCEFSPQNVYRDSKHSDSEQEETESTEADTILCSLGSLLFKKCEQNARI